MTSDASSKVAILITNGLPAELFTRNWQSSSKIPPEIMVRMTGYQDTSKLAIPMQWPGAIATLMVMMRSERTELGTTYRTTAIWLPNGSQKGLEMIAKRTK
jgi:hypothetical protein